MTDESSYRVGYKKPPLEHQFPKGKSASPDGGHKQKRAKKAKAKMREVSPQQMVVDWFTKKRRVKINGKSQEMTTLQLALTQLEEDVFVKRDPRARKLFFDISQRNGWFKAPPPRIPGTGVLVVNQIMSHDAWAKATEGELLPKNPLHGIPGAEHLLDGTPQSRRRLVPDDDG